MIWLIYVLLSFTVANEIESISGNENKKTIKKFNIFEDAVKFPSKNMENLIPPKPKELIKEQIDQIKLEARNFTPMPVTSSDIAIINTSHGTMKLELYPDKAPNHCLNFKKLANSGFYDGTIFHRVIPGFMIQGGDILSRDSIPENDGTGNPGWTVDQEFNDIKHSRGILSMARSRDVNSAGSQFFICTDEAYHLDNKYTVFGNLIDGDNVLDIITKIPSEAKQMIKSFKIEIPDNQSDENWIEYMLGGKKYFVKVPKSTTADIYKNLIKKRLRNKHRPFIPVTIKSIRVVDLND
tara:strand:- start:1392 stop:2276 length:885 start_codon:yes stop_codon:yes gene_type:complete